MLLIFEFFFIISLKQIDRQKEHFKQTVLMTVLI